MIIRTDDILKSLESYSNPRCKLQRLVDEGKYHQIIRGIYETDPDTPGQYIARSIRNPSYLSFEWALSYHGLIADIPYPLSSATTDTHRTKDYDTSFGRFTFRDVPKEAFGLCIDIMDERGYTWWVASPEKALCDLLYKMQPQRSVGELEHMLMWELGIDQKTLDTLDWQDILMLTPKYHSKNLDLLCRLQ